MTPRSRAFRYGAALTTGGLIGVPGGLIGLGGAEFRLPVLIGLFRLHLLLAVVVNLLVSLVTVAASLVFRAGLQDVELLLAQWPAAVNLLAGTLLGAYLGVHVATRVPERALLWMVAVLLVLLSLVLIGHGWLFAREVLAVPPLLRRVLGALAGVFIGVVSSLLGVAGGELIIPTLVLLFGLDMKLAGSVSLAISLPTIVLGLARYRSRPVFAELTPHRGFIAFMAAGSVAGAWLGSRLLAYVTGALLQVLLGLILLGSALHLLRAHHARPRAKGE